MRSAALLALALVLSGCVSDAAEESTGEDAGDDLTSVGSPTDLAAPVANVTAPAPPPVALAAEAGGFYPVNPTETVDKDSIASGALVTLTFTNNDLNPLGKHDWALEGLASAKTPVIDAGQSTEITFTAPSPGTYAFYCSVPGHRERGMEGTLTVT